MIQYVNGRLNILSSSFLSQNNFHRLSSSLIFYFIYDENHVVLQLLWSSWWNINDATYELYRVQFCLTIEFDFLYFKKYEVSNQVWKYQLTCLFPSNVSIFISLVSPGIYQQLNSKKNILVNSNQTMSKINRFTNLISSKQRRSS